jgi:hypothetical protein
VYVRVCVNVYVYVYIRKYIIYIIYNILCDVDTSKKKDSLCLSLALAPQKTINNIF